jgi:hypothetical protein
MDYRNVLGGQLVEDFTPVLSNTKSSIPEWILYFLPSSNILEVLTPVHVVFPTTTFPGDLLRVQFFSFSATKGTKGLGFISLVDAKASGDAVVPDTK